MDQDKMQNKKTSNIETMEYLLAEYLRGRLISNYSEDTVNNYRANVRYFIDWCDERGITQAAEVTRPVLDCYRKWLYYYRMENGKPLSVQGQHNRLIPLRSFFKWLTRYKYILYNPAYELELPRLDKKLPKNVLTIKEAELIMEQPDITQDLGLRDRAILETLYSTGMRRKELVRLKGYDFDMSRGTVMIRLGKGKKDRMLPIGERAIKWINKYSFDARPSLIVEPDEGFLFLTVYGEPISRSHLSHIVRSYVVRAGIGKEGSCHLLRHTMATLMLEGGADIRYVQEMLGHADLSTTQIYTKVSIQKLKEIHTITHPGSQLKRKKHNNNKSDKDL